MPASAICARRPALEPAGLIARPNTIAANGFKPSRGVDGLGCARLRVPESRLTGTRVADHVDEYLCLPVTDHPLLLLS